MENYTERMSQEKSYTSSDVAEHDAIDLRQLIIKYSQHWYWFVLAVIISLILATTYLKFQVDKYDVKTTILLQNSNSSILSSQVSSLDAFEMMSGVDKEVEDEIQILNSIKLIGQTIDELGIQIDYYKKEKLKYIELYQHTPFRLNLSQQFLDTLKSQIVLNIQKKKNKYHINFNVKNLYDEDYVLNNIENPFVTPLGKMKIQSVGVIKNKRKYRVVIHSKKNLINHYTEKLNVATVTKKTNVIQLSIVESNIEKGRNILDKIVELYNKDAINNKNILAINTANFIKDRLAIIGEQLSKAETNVENYKRSEDLTDLSSEATILLERVSEYTKKTAELKTQLNFINSLTKYITPSSEKIQLIPVNIVTDPALAASIEQYNQLVLEVMQLRVTASKENPLLIQMNNKIEILKNNVSAGIKNSIQKITIALQDLEKEEKSYKRKIKNVPTQERQYISVKRQQEIKQNIYLFLLQRQEDISLQLASTEPVARTIDRAYAELNPVAPKRNLIYLIALVFGLLIPLMVIYLLDLFQNKIETKEEFRRLVKAPFLGSICISREGQRVVVREKVSTPIIEMFNLIRTNLQFMVGKIKSPVILITSTISGEGKSFTSINLAMSLALTHKKVALLGLDIRRPKLNEYLEVGENTGITLYLSNNINSVDKLIVPSTHHSNLDLVPSGPVPPNPSELLMSDRLEKLINELKQRYDYIIVDTAPVGVVTDTYLLNRIADLSIFVSRKGFTPKEAMRLVNEISETQKLKNISTILNGTNESTEYGYTYGYRKKSSEDFMFKETFNDKLSRIYRKLRNKE